MARLQPPDDGAVVRMYRQGHGDCFLLAFPREGGGEPVYVLIDCGYKPGSQKFVHRKTSAQIAKHIGQATGNKIDLMIVTHEHQDHVNAIWKKNKPYFQPLDLEEAWLAWTEDPTDELAETLRQRHGDQLLGLVEARRQLALAVGAKHGTVRQLDGLLGFELGGESEIPDLAVSDPAKSVNKQALKLVKDKASARRGVRYLSPGGEPLAVPGTAGVRAFVLGPPRSEDLLEDEDPVGAEAFPGDTSHAHGLSFRAAVAAGGGGDAPFARRFRIPLAEGLEEEFFRAWYGTDDDPQNVVDRSEVAPGAAWRRIDAEWLHSAESLALKLNRGINNTSLVLAFELPRSRKVLLFVGDAQRGNWISWTDHTWTDGAATVTARDLLERTVLYKVGHHGSHNATLAGQEGSEHPNLAWMGRKVPDDEFCAMITAVREWAMNQNTPPWNHPLPSISAALHAKAAGRVLQTDTDRPAQPQGVSNTAWKKFTDRLTIDDFCFDLVFFDR
jgi:hypothetical protein